jgi:hypothetical protein
MIILLIFLLKNIYFRFIYTSYDYIHEKVVIIVLGVEV